MPKEEKAETVADIINRQEELRQQFIIYENRFVRLRELDVLQVQFAELEARIKKLEKK